MSFKKLLQGLHQKNAGLTILAKGLLIVVVPLVFQLVLIALITETGRQEERADELVARSQEILRQADRVLTQLVDAETGCRGYVLTGDPVFMEPFDRAQQELSQTLETLKVLVGDSSQRQSIIERIANDAGRWLEFQAENVRLVEAGDRDTATARIAAGTGKRQMDHLRREIAAFHSEMDRAIAERSALRERNHSEFRATTAIGAGLALLLGVLSAVVFSLGISTRLGAVIANIQRLAEGKELTAPVGGSDEIATVDRAFRATAQSLTQSREEMTKHTRVLRSMLDNMGDGVVVADEAGKLLVFNRAAEHIVGVAPNNAAPSEWSEYFGVFLPDQSTLYQPDQLPLVRAMRGEAVDAEELFVRNPSKPDGAWITVTARPILDERGLARGGVAVFQDVTQRRVAEQERDRFFDLSLDLLCIANADGYFKRINPAFHQTLGWSEAEILARPFIDFVHPDDRAATLQEVDRQVALNQPVLHFENRYRHKDGSWRVLAWRSVPQPGGFMYATGRDVTNADRAARALRLSEQNLAVTLDSIGDGVIATDTQRRITRMNRIAEQLTGWPRNEAIGRPIDDVFHIINESTREPAVIPVNDVLASGEIHGLANHTALIARDGTEKSIADSAAPIRDQSEEIIGVVLVFRDVTDERKVELLQKQFAAIVESSDDAIISKSLDGIILSWNQGAERIFGYTPQEAIGQPMIMLFPPGREAEEPQILAKLRRGERVEHLETQRVTKEGRLIDISATISPIKDSIGVVVAVSKIARDISDRKRFEQQLVAAREVAESANRAKSDFLASMSHELRTPLNGILRMNELLMSTELTERQRQFVQAGSTSGRALLQQINDILDLSKIEAGKLELDLQECHLEALVFDVVDVFVHTAQQKGLPLRCHFDPSACMKVICDDNRIRQILVNLLGNALKFTKEGEITVRTECQKWLDDQMTLRISVTDTGRGIPEDRHNRLFTPFSQVDSSTAREFGGTGLGLSICKQLVELMAGQIGVESQLGVGSTFWFELTLPVVAEDSVVGKCRHTVVGRRVLVVDGVESNQRQIMDCLQAWGCRAEKVANVQSALEAVAVAESEGTSFAAVLADCHLVAGDEYVLLQKLTKPPFPPVIGIGVNPDDETIAYLNQLGVRHVLRTPVRPSTLFNALTSVLAVKTVSAQLTPDTTVEETLARFTGHILVAEDNSINQMFVRELLKHCGCTCDIANNGDEALIALQRSRYDLVLMDCQMPELDGFIAAREIRRRESAGDLPSRLPTVALTANALKGDRERCLESGMDDYLSKPLQAAQLQAKLARHLAPRFGKPTVESFEPSCESSAAIEGAA